MDSKSKPRILTKREMLDKKSVIPLGAAVDMPKPRIIRPEERPLSDDLKKALYRIQDAERYLSAVDWTPSEETASKGKAERMASLSPYTKGMSKERLITHLNKLREERQKEYLAFKSDPTKYYARFRPKNPALSEEELELRQLLAQYLS